MREQLLPAKLLRFGLTGASTALLFFVLVYLLFEQLGVDVVLASTAACTIALVYNYKLHYSWTFKSATPHGRALFRYLVMSGCGVAINSLAMYVTTQNLALHWLYAQTLAGAAMISWNLLVSAQWVYRD